MLQSLHDTQQEHHAKIEQLREDMEAGFDDMRSRFDDMRSRFDRVHVGIDTIHSLLTGKIEQENPES